MSHKWQEKLTSKVKYHAKDTMTNDYEKDVIYRQDVQHVPPDPPLLPSYGFSTPLPSCCLSMITLLS